MSLIRCAVQQLQSTVFDRAVADLIIVGFFYLLRPGEHCYNKENDTPFRLQDVSFTIPNHAPTNVNACQSTADLRGSASLVHLNFTNQKNGRKDEAVTHGVTPDPMLSPLHAVARRVAHLQAHSASADTPLHTVFLPTGPARVTGRHITTALRRSCTVVGPSVGLNHHDISARALRAGGAMALLRAGVDSTEARLMGRWRSWAMIEYLHQCAFDTTTFATRMLTGGAFVIQRHAKLPSDVQARLEARLVAA